MAIIADKSKTGKINLEAALAARKQMTRIGR
jgi:hypothetical protein